MTSTAYFPSSSSAGTSSSSAIASSSTSGNYSNFTSSLELPAELSSQYRFLSYEIGCGCFSNVQLAESLITHEKVAIKIIPKASLSPIQLQGIYREAAILKETTTSVLDSNQTRHIIDFYDFYETATHFYLIMEYIAGGELFHSIISKGYYPEEEAKVVLYQLLKTLHYLHEEKQIIHRDIKPENILIVPLPNTTTSSIAYNVQIKLIDFGFAAFNVLEKNQKDFLGTPGYIAPEILQGRKYGKAVDLWSVGIVLYILLVGYPPFSGKSSNVLTQQTLKCRYSLEGEDWEKISNEAKDLIRHLILVNPDNRFTTQQALNHPWFLNLRNQDFTSSSASTSSSSSVDVMTVSDCQTMEISDGGVVVVGGSGLTSTTTPFKAPIIPSSNSVEHLSIVNT